MLTPLEIGQFHAFGFVVLRACLAPAEIAALEDAYAAIMPTAPRYDYFGSAGTRMILHFVDHHDAFAAFVGHPRIAQAVRALFGRPALLLGSDIWWNLDATPWHSDGPFGGHTQNFKVTTYLDPMTAAQGALRIVPGSHHPAYGESIMQHCGYWDQRRPRLRLTGDDVPGSISIEAQPGDVILWQNHMWHAGPPRADGRPRRGLFLSYAPDPDDNLLVLDHLRHIVASQATKARPFLYSRRLLRCGGDVVQSMAQRAAELLGPEVCETPA